MIVGQHVTFILMKPLPLHCFRLKDFEYCCMLANLVSRSQLPKWQMNTHKVTSRNTTFWQKDNKVTPTFPLWHCFTALIFKKILTAYVSCTYSVHTLTFLYFSGNSDKRHDRKHTSLCSLFFVLLQLGL